MTAWFELSVDTESLHSERIEEALMEIGAVAVTLSDCEDCPVLEPLPGETPLWPKTRVTGLFTMPCDADALKASLLSFLEVDHLPFSSHQLQDKDWIRAWMDHYQPMQFGKQLWICPTHLSPPDPKAVTVMLDPGLAFGTGTHPTTALCLEWLEAHQSVFQGQAVIDYGCGSGVLAVAAKMLGASEVYGTDIDPQAIEASLVNAERNGVHIAECTLPEHFSPPPAKVVLANILAGPLVALAPILSALTLSGGHLVLAGLLSRDAELVKSAYLPWFEFQETAYREDWARLHAIKR